MRLSSTPDRKDTMNNTANNQSEAMGSNCAGSGASGSVPHRQQQQLVASLVSVRCHERAAHVNCG